jgi:hypothetical protein
LPILHTILSGFRTGILGRARWKSIVRADGHPREHVEA